jgi:hypothetical protein
VLPGGWVERKPRWWVSLNVRGNSWGTTDSIRRCLIDQLRVGGAMVFDYDADATPANRVAEYRNSADMMRSLAQQMRFGESRVKLLALADSFDKLADRVDERESGQPTGVNEA